MPVEIPRLEDLVDPDTVAMRDKMLGAIASVTSAEQLWEVYRSQAVPAGAPPLQLVETQRAIYWTIAALAQVLARRPQVLQSMVEEVSQYGYEQLKRELGN